MMDLLRYRDFKVHPLHTYQRIFLLVVLPLNIDARIHSYLVNLEY